jgi:hypothetical protein
MEIEFKKKYLEKKIDLLFNEIEKYSNLPVHILCCFSKYKKTIALK